MSFGFDPETVFGNNGKKKKNGVGSSVFGRPNGIPTFRTEDPMIDVFGLGEDFGERIGRRAGKANGKEGGFLGIIGTQQRAFGIPRVVGREPTVAGARRAKKGKGRRQPKVSSGFEGLETTLFGAERTLGKTVGADVKVIKKKVTRFKARREAKQTRKKAGLNGGVVRFREGTRFNNKNNGGR